MELTLDQTLQKAITAHKAGQFEEADRLYLSILKAQPTHPDANHNKGVLSVGLGKLDTSLFFFKTALETNPTVPQFWLSYIDALIKLGRMIDAKTAYDQARATGIKSDAFKLIKQKLESAPLEVSDISINQDPSGERLQLIFDFYNQGQFQQALEKVELLLKQFPTSSILYNIEGAANTGLQQFDAAVESYTRAIKINPNYADAYNNMG